LLDIDAGIIVSIQAVPTMLAKEETLSRTVRAVLMPALTTHLGCVSWVNLDHINPSCLSFIGQETMELSKAPTMEASLLVHVLVLLAASDLRGLPNVGEVFQNNRAARCSVLDDALREDMIMVTTLPKQFARKLFQVPFGRLRALLLELASRAKDTAFLFLPTSLTQKLAFRGDSRTIHTQVNTDRVIGVRNDWGRDGNDQVKEVAGVAVAKISTAYLVAYVLLGILRNRERQFHAPGNRSKAYSESLPLDPGGTLVITDWTESDAWTRDRLEDWRFFAFLPGLLNPLGICCLMFLCPRECGFDRLSSLHTSGTDQLRR